MFLEFLPISLLLTLIFCFILIKLDKIAAKKGVANVRNSPQTLHRKSISRFGGVAILGALMISTLMAEYTWENSLYYQVGIISLPAFFIGFLDDIRLELNPYIRMILILPVPILYFYYFDLRITNLDIGFLDSFLNIEIFALFFLCFSIVGMINAFNLVDGINGLLGSYILSIIASLKIVEYATGGPIFSIDDDFRIFTNILLGALFGFLLLNFPSGRIFLGDAGAYYLGALVCFGLIYAHLQNISTSSPWVVFCLLMYPFTDLVFSVFRKRIVLGEDPLKPDAMHLHHVIFKRLNKLNFKNNRTKHFFTVIFITIFNLPYLCLSLYFLNNAYILITIFISYFFTYLLLYFSLSPRFLIKNDKK